MTTSSSTQDVSRRGFLSTVSAGSLVLMAKLSGSEVVAAACAHDAAALAFEPDLFVSIAPDGVVTIVAHRSEMGTGIRTALPMVVADELEADWDRVVIDQAPGDARFGSQDTDGSRSIRRFFDRMRLAGGTARTMLERAAAQKWKVDAVDCRARNHEVVHAKSNRRIGFGDLVEDASKLSVPKPAEVKFKPASERRYIGKTKIGLADIDDIVTGKATYGIDARMENQVFAVVARPPVLGGNVKSYDATKAKAMAGVVAIVEIPPFKGAPAFQPLGGIAVCATSTWAAMEARDALEIQWEASRHDSYDTSKFAKELAAAARKPGNVVRTAGDTDKVLSAAAADAVHEADYFVPHLAHAPMETPCAVADVQTDAGGKVTSCHVLAATQNPQACQDAVAPALGIPKDKVVVDVTLLGAGFGRKSKPDYVVEAAILSRKLGRPVHVTWTREDDIRHDYYHTIAAIHMRASVDAKGMPTAWLQRVVNPSIGSTFNPAAQNAATFELGMGFSDIPYAVPNLQIENPPARNHLRIGWLRSVAHIYQAFAVCSFPDELAHRAGRDPLEYFLELIGEDRQLDLTGVNYPNHSEPLDKFPFDVGRLRHVTKRAAEIAEWGRDLPKGRGLGIAAHRSFLSYCAHVVEVEVQRDGTLVIPKVWVVIDAGTVIYPDRVRSQLEGAAIMGTTQARYGQITAKNGRVEQSNFDDYEMARMSDAPREIFVDIVKSDDLPAGVGEVGVPTFAPALCNAIVAATGKRVRNLPLSGHDLSWA